MSGPSRLYTRLRSLPFPRLGKEVGDFGLYDDILAGYAQRLEKGSSLADMPSDIEADAETMRFVAEIEAKKDRTREEQDLLDYWGVLEEIRTAAMAAMHRRRIQ
jgi:hypothetical protein